MSIKNKFQSTNSQLREKICQKIDQIKCKKAKEIAYKDDQSPITVLDNFISDLIKENFKTYIAEGYTFYSEEDHKQLQSPCIILDPLDGTKEFIKDNGECAVSLAIFDDLDSMKGILSWIYNPFKAFEVESGESSCTPKKRDKLLGLVSHTEWDQGLYQEYREQSEINLKAVGSIAYKLALLANGDCDFVITKKPKHIWDIAAGTMICQERGIDCFTKKGKLQSLNFKKIDGPILWCRRESQELLNQIFLS
jgi:myo-inositol-1(or 4)-monophosphatase